MAHLPSIHTILPSHGSMPPADDTRKRRRANTHGDTQPTLGTLSALSNTQQSNPGPRLTRQVPAHSIEVCVNSLQKEGDGKFLKQLLVHIATSQPQIANVLRQAYEDVLQRERARVIDFDHHSKHIWYTINKEHRKLSGSKAYDISFDVFFDVEATITSIGEQAGAATTSFGTKQSGLETLRKIAKTICLSSNDTLGHEVQKQFQQTSCMEDAMSSVIDSMTEAERAIMCDVNDGRSSFREKLEELRDLAQDHCVFENMEEVIAKLVGEEFDDEGEEEETEEEEDEGEEDGGEEEEEEEEEEVASIRTGGLNSTRPLQFANDEEEFRFLDMYDSDGCYDPQRRNRNGRRR